MNDITQQFGSLYHPCKALLFYRSTNGGYHHDYYVESYDMDDDGRPVNPHPLSVKESAALAKALQAREKKAQAFLTPEGLLPQNLLYLKSGKDGCAIWHTPQQRANMLFAESLGIPSGEASLPALIWKATKNTLLIFACKKANVLNEHLKLYHAPFFDTYQDGRVCMGNVQVHIPNDCGLEALIRLWQDYFFNSYFSHLMGGHQPVKGNAVQLWQTLTGTRKPFPEDVLLPNRLTLKNLLP